MPWPRQRNRAGKTARVELSTVLTGFWLATFSMETEQYLNIVHVNL